MSRNPEKRRASNRAWDARNREQRREIAKTYRANNPDKIRENNSKRDHHATYVRRFKYHLLAGARRRAELRGLAFNIELSDIEVPFACPLLGCILMPNKGLAPNSPTLDRKNPKKGYVKGNIWVISHRANAAKNDLTLDELKTLVTNLEKHQR